MTPVISATAMGRRYRDQAALEDVSLAVEPGTVTGLLGRNGAGKTTLMRIVAGQEFPTSGTIAVFGEAPAENEAVLRRMVFVREEQAGPLEATAQARARALHLSLEPLSLQQLLVHAASSSADEKVSA